MVTEQSCKLIRPYGGHLVDLIVDPEEAQELNRVANRLPSIKLTPRSVCDLELLASGAFSPLDRFVGREDYERILQDMRLASGHLFPMPVTLPVALSHDLHLDSEVALRSPANHVLAILRIEELFSCDRENEAQVVLGTNDPRHPLVAEMQRWPDLNVSGRLRVIQLPPTYDFRELRMGPQETRSKLASLGRKDVVAFQTRNPLHRAHEEMTKRAIAEIDGTLLLHPVVGLTKPGDVDHYTRVRTYKVVADRYYDADRVVLALLPLAMRMAGPREALWHAIIRRNYGANHFIVGRDHASPGVDSNNNPFYEPYAAQELVKSRSEELGVNIISFREIGYSQDTESYSETSEVRVSGTEAREQISRGKSVPQWLMRPEVAEILSAASSPKNRQGVCVWFTGLSGAGKSTTAEILTVLLLENGRRVTLLDGDVVRTQLSDGLGFSKADRDRNVRRIGFVASEVVRHGGVAVCALVSPYRAARNEVRNLFPPGAFVEVFVDTPLAVCEERDPKGIYARARRGEITQVTGIDDPYEEPPGPELTIDGNSGEIEDNARRVLHLLRDKGFIESNAPLFSDKGEQCPDPEPCVLR